MLDAEITGRPRRDDRLKEVVADRTARQVPRSVEGTSAEPTTSSEPARKPEVGTSAAAKRTGESEASTGTTRDQRQQRLALMRACLQASLDEIENHPRCGDRCARLLIDRCFYALETIATCWRYDSGPVALTRIPSVLGVVIAEAEEVLEGGPSIGLGDVVQELRVAVSLFPDFA